MSSLLGILIAIIAFGFVIFIHELGHFIAAKKSGVTVLEFAIGMGPAIFKKTVGETTYALRLFPIGGFVLMDDDETNPDDSKSYTHAPIYKRAIIMVAGAVMNFILGVVLVLIFTMFFMKSDAYSFYSTTVERFSDTASSVEQLSVGDEILRVNGNKTDYLAKIAYYISWDNDGIVDLNVNRSGEEIVLKDVKFPRVQLVQRMYTNNLDFATAAGEATVLTKLDMSWLTVKELIRQIWGSLISLVRGDVGPDQLSGPVGITQQITEVSMSNNKQNTILFIAMISLNLAVLNLLPLPLLDGNKLLLLLIEAIRKKPVSEKVQLAINGVGLLMFGALFLFVTFNDITRLVGGIFS